MSLFDNHTDIITWEKETSGREWTKCWLNEMNGEIVSHYRILVSNSSDELAVEA